MASLKLARLFSSALTRTAMLAEALVGPASLVFFTALFETCTTGRGAFAAAAEVDFFETVAVFEETE